MVIVTICVFLSFCIGFGIYAWANYRQTMEPDGKIIEDAAVVEKEAFYIAETCYDGTNIPLVLYSYPFRKTEEMYVCNKEYAGKLADSYINGMYETSKEFVTLMFANNHTSIKNKEYEETI